MESVNRKSLTYIERQSVKNTKKKKKTLPQNDIFEMMKVKIYEERLTYQVRLFSHFYMKISALYNTN